MRNGHPMFQTQLGGSHYLAKGAPDARRVKLATRLIDDHVREEGDKLLAGVPRGKEIHLIADNLSAHKTKRVEQFLTAHPKVHLHYTPTYSPGSTR